MSRLAAEFRNVSKVYPIGLFGRGRRPAVVDVNLTLETGEVLALLGPNRAGKTTLAKLLLSLCRPTSGDVFRLGSPVSDRSTLARIGYVHENQAFPRHLSAAMLLEYYGALTLLPADLVRQRAPELLDRVGLADRARDPIHTFSKGMVQRLAVAQALLNDPELLVLDEPTEGLDLPGRKLMHDVAREWRSRGRSVLLVTHVPGEVEPLCDRAAVIVGGRLCYVGPIAGLTKNRPLEAVLGELYAGAVA